MYTILGSAVVIVLLTILPRISSSQVTCPSNGLIAHWKLNESSWQFTNTVKDSIKPYHHATAYGATPVSGLFGNSAYFDGNDFIVAGNVGRVENWTVMFWMNTENFSDYRNPFDANFEIFERVETGTNIGPRFEQSDFTTADYRLILQNKVYRLSGILPTNTWIHTAAVRDGNTLRVYLNGQEVVNTPNTDWPRSFANVVLGLGYSNEAHESNRYFIGMLDGVRIYNRALTARQAAICATL